MKVLFLTTYGVSVAHEHFFTRNVLEALGEHSGHGTDVMAACVLEHPGKGARTVTEESCEFGMPYYVLHLCAEASAEEKIEAIARFFTSLNPDIIHSNMIEGMDVVAAKRTGIPIVLTMHIGGLVCPRGGGNGLLRHDDTICNGIPGAHCVRCMVRDLPFPAIGRGIYRLFHSTALARRLARRNPPLLYFTPLFKAPDRVKERIKILRELRYAHVIAANRRLASILANHFDKPHIHLLPHGVKPRTRLPLPPADGPVRFYILSRIQYSKGIVETLRAFRGIPHGLYELHIIGDEEKSGSSRRYAAKVRKEAKDVNAIFHGRLPNERIEEVIEYCHVMIHPTFCHEVYGIAIAESLSLGRPVIATRCGGAEMQIEDGVNGWLVQPHSSESIRGAVEEILGNPELVGRRAAKAELPMPIDSYIENLNIIYHDIIAGR